METGRVYHISKLNQYLMSSLLVSIVSVLCYGLSEYIGYRVVALILLVTVSVIAMLFDILPVLLAAVISALVWNFFFIPPKFTFTIGNTEDLLMFLMYFFIALLNGVFSYKARKIQEAAILKEEKSKTLTRHDSLIKSVSEALDFNLEELNKSIDKIRKSNAIEQSFLELSSLSSLSSELCVKVKNLLYSSRFDAGPIHPKKSWVSINPFMLSIAKKIEKQGLTQPIHLNIPSDMPLFKLDEHMMELAIYNIINHLSKSFTQKSNIEVYAILHINVLQIVVEDNNSGFTAKEAESIKKQLEIERPATDDDFGLSVAGSIIDLHRGVIHITNKTDGGLKLVIDIPVETSTSKAD